jgi:outer membrane biogenesis lipoprotein LolB
MRELLMMKTRILAFCLLAVAGLIFSGCTTTTTTETQTDQTTKRVHTQEELKKSGETNPAAALEKTDPAVRMSGPR